jgi:hypothetical protein
MEGEINGVNVKGAGKLNFAALLLLLLPPAVYNFGTRQPALHSGTYPWSARKKLNNPRSLQLIKCIDSRRARSGLVAFPGNAGGQFFQAHFPLVSQEIINVAGDSKIFKRPLCVKLTGAFPRKAAPP